MSAEKIQEYFDEHPIKKLARGAQFRVYDAPPHLVLKKYEPRRLFLEASIRTNAKNLNCEPMSVEQMRKFLRDLMEEQLCFGKKRLGGLILPFETPRHVKTKLIWRKTCNIIREEMNFYDPVVQERRPKKDRFAERSKRAVRKKDIETIIDLYQNLLTVHSQLIGVGAHPFDSRPSNFFALPGNEVLISDVGSLIHSKRKMRVILKSDDENIIAEREKMRDRWLHFYLSLIDKLSSIPEIEELIEEFTDRFSAFYEPRIINRMGKQRGKPVPEVTIPD